MFRACMFVLKQRKMIRGGIDEITGNKKQKIPISPHYFQVKAAHVDNNDEAWTVHSLCSTMNLLYIYRKS